MWYITHSCEKLCKVLRDTDWYMLLCVYDPAVNLQRSPGVER